MHRRHFLERAAIATASVTVLAGCTDANLKKAEAQPPSLEDTFDEAKVNLPVPQKSEKVEAGILEAEDADIRDRDGFEAYLDESGLRVEKLEESVEKGERKLSLEYVEKTAEKGALSGVGTVAGGYATLVEAGDESESLTASLLEPNRRKFGEFEVVRDWATQCNEGAISAAKYGRLVTKTVESKRWSARSIRLSSADSLDADGQREFGDSAPSLDGGTMTVENLHDKFVYELQEMYYIENQLVEVLDQLAADVANEDLRMGFERHRDQTKTQVGRLEEVFEILDEPPEERPSLVFDALIEERDRFFDQAGGDEDMRDLYDLGAGVKTEHLEIAGYGSLIQLARKLELQDDVGDLLNENLDEEQQTKKQLKTLGEDSTVRKMFARLAG